jgi:hypothetical protein
MLACEPIREFAERASLGATGRDGLKRVGPARCLQAEEIARIKQEALAPLMGSSRWKSCLPSSLILLSSPSCERPISDHNNDEKDHGQADPGRIHEVDRPPRG